MRILPFFRAFSVSVIASLSAPSQNITKVTWATPDWEGMTNMDGTGLYHDVISTVYGRSGIQVIVEYAPWARATAEVESGEADFTGGDSPTDKFAQPKVPLIRHIEIAFFKKTAVPVYSGLADLDQRLGVWVRGYVDNMPDDIKRHLKGTGNSTRVGAVEMVLSGRADYYLDNDYQMSQTLKAFEGQYKPSEYATGLVEIEDLFLCCTKSPRGRRLAELFDQGMKKLAISGELTKIYAKWNRVAPPVK
jgi:polar amino acid transport system substrate-binding protein